MSDFNTFKLGDVAFISAGGDKPKIFSDVITEKCNIPVFANGETNNGLQGFTDKAKILEPAVTVSARGTIGFAVLRKEPFFPIVRLLTLLPKKEILDIGFLFYFLKLYRQNGIGSSQAQLIAPEIANRNILLPDLPTQQKIASVLSALDDKIELNNRINAELEAMVKTLYDYWFVQFDFPIVTSSGVEKPYKSSGGKMVYNEILKREIPEGWEVKKMSFFEMYQPQTISEKELNKDHKYYVFGANGIIGKYDKFNHLDSEIVVTCRGNSCGNIIRTLPESWITGNAMVIKSIEDFIESEFIFQMLNWIGIKKVITGSGQPQITRVNLETLDFVLPKKNILSQFNELVRPIVEKKLQLFKQNQELSALRDWLLPMLMNGQVKVG